MIWSVILERYKKVIELSILLTLRGLFLIAVCTVLVCPQRMGVLNVGQRIEEQAEFEKIYKNGNVFCVLAC